MICVTLSSILGGGFIICSIFFINGVIAVVIPAFTAAAKSPTVAPASVFDFFALRSSNSACVGSVVVSRGLSKMGGGDRISVAFSL